MLSPQGLGGVPERGGLSHLMAYASTADVSGCMARIC